jgi:60 kDa SS-A/Ro ribonucleoprotein
MTRDPLSAINTRETAQSEQARPDEVANNAGGHVFEVSEDTRVHRFLTLGVDGGTYYVSEKDLTKDNAEAILKVARERGEWLVDKILEISEAGRAPRNNPALFALAAVAGLGSDEAQDKALKALPRVARTGTHLFTFTRYVEQFRGWGPRLKRGIQEWYLGADVGRVAYQCVKYRQRDGWSHRDLLRKAHPITNDVARNDLFHWITQGNIRDEVPRIVRGFLVAQNAKTVDGWLAAINGHNLTWEMLPDAALGEKKVWEALIEKGMPQTALMRQLPRLTRLGVLDNGEVQDLVITQLGDVNRLRGGRVHPVNVLIAQRTYASGESARGKGTWTPKRRIVDALDDAFYAAFGAVEAAHKRTLLALDVSGSMSVWRIADTPVTPREASAALALVTMATETETDVVGFMGGRYTTHGTQIQELPISPRQRLDDVVRGVSGLDFGGTDCSLPMLWALEGNREYDTFVIYTDSETWAGNIHPWQALKRYRERTGINARLVVVGMTSAGFTIADPTDPGMLDIAGFDSSVPNLINDFSRGDV